MLHRSEPLIYAIIFSFITRDYFCMFSQVSVVNQLDMQVVVSNVPPTVVEQKKDQLIG